MSSKHGIDKPAGIDFVARSRFNHGRFGRLFGNLDPARHSESTLRALAEQMVDTREPEVTGNGWGGGKGKKADGDNPTIPAGYTYLGQFIDHDITFDPASELLRDNDPNALHNFRTPRFDLDNLYGEGPDDEPFLYEKRKSGKEKMLLEDRGKGEFDLPRNSEGTAIIGDPRNDENTVVSQLQATMLRAHNKLVDAVGAPPAGRFQEARRQLRWHYQYVVVNDFLRRIVPKGVLDELLPKGTDIGWCELCHCTFGHGLPFMPVEFSAAAYRFGHSMVRPAYDLNDGVLDREIFDQNERPAADLTDLRGFRPLPPKWGIDWGRFFKVDQRNPQPSRLIDIKLAIGLTKLPGIANAELKSLAVRNLLRGQALNLPSGEAVAKCLGEKVLTPEQVLGGLKLKKEEREELEGRTPLWFYVLREAEELGKGGETLGPAGGWIVARTLLCLLAGDRFSYVNVEPGWSPKQQGLVKQKGKKDEEFEMADLIRFATT